MYIMKKSDPNSMRISMDISTTRLFSVHAYITSGIGTIKVSQSNFNNTDRYEPISSLDLNSSLDESKNAVICVKDAPTKYFMVELESLDNATVVEIEIIYK